MRRTLFFFFSLTITMMVISSLAVPHGDLVKRSGNGYYGGLSDELPGSTGKNLADQ